MTAPFMGEDLTIIEGTSADARRERGTAETIGNVVSLSARDMSSRSLMRMADLSAMNHDGERMDVETLKELYPEDKELFSYPLTEKAAQAVIKEKKVRSNLEQEIALGPQGFGQDALNFVAGMIPHAVDPVDFVAGYGVGKAFTMSVRGAKLAATLSKIRGGTFVKDVGVAAVGNVVVEPVTFAAAAAEGRDYGIDQAFFNSVGGAVIGVSFFKGVGYGINKLTTTKTGGVNLTDAPKAVNEILGKSPEAAGLAMTMARSQLDSGKMADVSLLNKDMAKEIAPTISRIEPENIKTGNTMYAASVNETTLSFVGELGDDLTYITLDRGMANGAAGSKYSDIVGEVVEFQLGKDVRLVDVDRAVPPELKEVFGVIDDVTTMKQIIDEVGPDEVSRQLSELGYDGYYKENGIALFSPEKLVEVSRAGADVNAVARASQDELLDIHRTEAAREDSPFDRGLRDIDDSARDLLDATPKTDQEIIQEFDVAVKDADDLLKQGILDEATVQNIKEIGETTSPSKIQELFSSAINCMSRAFG
jgi:hypothetical protein